MTGPGWEEIEALRDVLSSAPTFIRFLGAEAAAAVRREVRRYAARVQNTSRGRSKSSRSPAARRPKQHALAELCRTYSIPAARVLAIGDSRNDVPMLQWAGIGVAMANALPEVRDAIATHTASNDDDGVAEAIERFVLSGDARKSA